MTIHVRVTVELACVLEATARKPGNVHRDRDFPKLSYLQFLASAAAIGPALGDIGKANIGQAILEAVRATRQVVDTNTNLGMILLLAPLAAAANRPGDLRTNLNDVLDAMTVEMTWAAKAISTAGGELHQCQLHRGGVLRKCDL